MEDVLAIRGKVNEELRARRLAAYPPVYRLSAALSFWPPADIKADRGRPAQAHPLSAMPLSAGKPDASA